MNPTRPEVEALIRQLAPECGLIADLCIRQCEAESQFNQSAVSSCGALGLFQLMPRTASWLKVDPLDWRANVRGALNLMQHLQQKFGGYDKALAAYNCGEWALAKIIQAHGEDWRGNLSAETRGYLNKVLACGTK